MQDSVLVMGDDQPQDTTRFTGSCDDSQTVSFPDAAVHESQPLNPHAASFSRSLLAVSTQTALLVSMKISCMWLYPHHIWNHPVQFLHGPLVAVIMLALLRGR